MINGFRRQLHNPIEFALLNWPDADISHITYDPNMKAGDREYWRIEQSGGDGTYAFTVEMLQKAILPILNRTTYFIDNPPTSWDDVIEVKYTIGDMRHVTVFGKVELRCGGKYDGQRERVRMPVKCEYVYKSDITPEQRNK